MLKQWLAFSLLMIPIHLTIAGVEKAPPAFELNRGSQAIFVDFVSAVYHITYDLEANKTTVRSEIRFKSEREGFPIFDLVPGVLTAELNGQKVEVGQTSFPGNASQVRYLKRKIEAGEYTFVLTHQIEKNVSLNANEKTVKSAFWMSDLSDRRYLEQYLPTNLEFDQFQMTLNVSIKGSDKEHILYSNGAVKVLSKNQFRVVAPEYFTASSLFFHLTPKGEFREIRTEFSSMDGRIIPITFYSRQSNLETYKTRTLSTLKELEIDYGPFPHDKVVIYGAGSGGMEYCGATITSLWALGHELIHSYFARGVMPARGNAGWVDEAIASWRDDGYPSVNRNRLRKTQMAGHSIYRRTTDRAAYSSGARFMGYLNKKFESQGGLKKFLKEFKDRYLFSPFLTKDFQTALEKYFNTSLEQDFNTYVYGRRGLHKYHQHDSKGLENPYHPKLSQKELFDLL